MEVDNRCTKFVVKWDPVSGNLRTLHKIMRAILGAMLPAPQKVHIDALVECYTEFTSGSEGPLADLYSVLNRRTPFKAEAEAFALNRDQFVGNVVRFAVHHQPITRKHLS